MANLDEILKYRCLFTKKVMRKIKRNGEIWKKVCGPLKPLVRQHRQKIKNYVMGKFTHNRAFPSDFYFPHMKYGKYWFHLDFILLLIFLHKTGFRAKKNFRLSRGVAGVAIRSLVEICIDDISALLRATDLRFRLTFVSWVELIHLILRILKF
jgi:hypothetical protein